MIYKFNPEQLHAQLKKKVSHKIYILLGNDFFLLQESQKFIQKIAESYGFNDHYSYILDNNTNWEEIFFLCKKINLFVTRYTLSIFLPENGLNAIAINKQLETLVSLLHEDMLLIIQGNKLTKKDRNTVWFRKLIKYSVEINCQTPDKEKLLYWIFNRAKQYNLHIDKDACHFLYYSYEGNLLALVQVLEQISLLWRDRKLTLSRIKSIVTSSAYFTSFQWVDAVLSAKSRRALHILNRFRLNNREPMVLIRSLQHELLLLLSMKRHLSNTPLYILFDKHHIWKKRREIMYNAIHRLNKSHLCHAVQILTRIELTVKQNNEHLVWFELERLSLFLCNGFFATIINND